MPACGPRFLAVNLLMPINHVASPLALYQVYQVLSYPISNPDNFSVSSVVGLPEIFAISIDKVYTVSMSLASWMTCHGGFIKYCSAPMSLQMLTPHSCLHGIYLDNMTAVLSYCSFETTSFPFNPTFVKYGTHAIISALSEIPSVVCPTLNASLPISCMGRICLIDLPCHCTFSMDSHLIVSGTQTCHLNLSSVVFYIAENLYFLSSYFQPMDILDLQPHYVFQPHLLSHLPKIPEDFLHRFQSALSSMDHSFHSNLSHLIAKVKEDASVTLFHPPAFLPSHGFTDLFSVLGLILGVIATCLGLYAVCKIRALFPLLLGRGRVMGVKVISELSTTPAANEQPLDTHNIEYNFHLSYTTLVALMVFCGFVMLALVLFYLRMKVSRQVRLSLLVFNNHQSQIVDLFTIPCNLYNYKISGQDVVKRVRTSTFMLNVIWKDLVVTVNDIKFILPNAYYISPWTARRIRAITREEHAFLVLVRYGCLMVQNVGYIGELTMPTIWTNHAFAY